MSLRGPPLFGGPWQSQFFLSRYVIPAKSVLSEAEGAVIYLQCHCERSEAISFSALITLIRFSFNNFSSFSVFISFK
jgi:hypothetical protein